MKKYIILLSLILVASQAVSSDQRIQYTEKMVGAGHPSLTDTLNRLTLVGHNSDGSHKGWVNAAQEGNIMATLAAIPATTAIMVTDVQTVTPGTTIAHPLIMLPGGVINVASGTVTISGAFDAGLYQVFTGSGAIVFGSNLVSAIHPEWFGVTGTNDEVAIQKAHDASTTIPVEYAAGKTYYISDQLFWGSNRIIGNGATIQVQASASFTGSKLTAAERAAAISLAGTSIAAIYTKSALGGPYAASFATQELYIENLTISMNRTSALAVSTPLLIENVTRGHITGYTDTATAATATANMPVNGIDFFANNHNIVVEKGYFAYMSNPNGTMVSPQGGLWVRAYGTAAVGTTTGRITFRDCEFFSNQLDEPLAIFTHDYVIDGVLVDNCKFYTYDARNRFITAHTTGGAGAAVKNVTFRKCYMETVSGSSIIVLEAAGSTNTVVDDCKIKCTLAKLTESVTYVIQGAHKVINSDIEVTSIDSGTVVSYGINNAQLVVNTNVVYAAACFTAVSDNATYIRPVGNTNTVRGCSQLTGTVYNCGEVQGNEITGVILTCRRVHGNYIKPATNNLPIANENITTADHIVYQWHDNYIEDTFDQGATVAAILGLIDQTASYYIHDNHYSGTRASFGISYAEGQVLNFENNTLNNTGTAASGPWVRNTSRISSASGNTPAAEFAQSAKNFPIGHIITNTNNATDTTIWGWIKHTTDGSNSAHWRELAP